MIPRLYSILITGFFLTMAVFLFRDHVIPSFQRTDAIDIDRRVLTDSWADVDDFNYVMLDDMRLGAIRTIAESEPVFNDRGKFTGRYYVTGAHLEVRTLAFNGRLLMSAKLNRRLELEQVMVRAHLPGLGQKPYEPEVLAGEELPDGAYELAGLVQGGQFFLRLRRDDAVQYRQFRLARPVTMTDSITPILRGNMLTQGETYAVDVYEPLYGGQAGQVEVTWVDEEVVPDANDVLQTNRIIELEYQNTRTRMVVDPAGQVIERRIPLFAGNSQQAKELGGASILLRRREMLEVTGAYPNLMYIMPPPELSPEEMQGEDRGQVVRLNMLSMFGSGMLGS